MFKSTGWNTWDVKHLNAVAHLPSKARLRFSLLNPSTGEIKDEFGWRRDLRRLGRHADDGSYSGIELQWAQAVVQFEYAADGDRLVCRITPRDGAGRLVLLVQIDGAWGHAIPAVRDGDRLVAATSSQTWVAYAPGNAVVTLPDAQTGLAFECARPILVVAQPGEMPKLDAQSASALIDQQRAAYATTSLRSAGWLDEAADALTRSIAWNTIWEPIKGRVCTPVSRDWCKGAFFGSYVLFDWDTFFCAVMAQLEDPGLAEANALAILQEVSPAGCVPNFGCEFGPSEDRSQPPVGAYCVLKLYRASSMGQGDRARSLLERTFPRLLRWHDWWMPHRDGNGDGLLEWGSDHVPGYRDDWQSNNMQAAMYESGLDNSPMYDDAVYNPHTHTMELADVGLNALYALDAWALSEIARELGQVTRSQDLAAQYAHMARLINENLWSDAAGIYLNRHWDGRLSPHLSPTLFYPLIAGIAPRERAGRMVREHLLNEHEFWGRFVMPSIARTDPGYAGNDYWRGRIWGPMNFLVSEGLRRCGFDDAAHEFARRSLDLLLGEWHAEGHVHENFNADTGDGDDMPNSDPMYTWGALLGYIAMQELVDCEPWSGWRFGNLQGETASLKGVRVGDSILDASIGAHGLDVAMNGRPFIRSDKPVLIRGLRREPSHLVCHIETPTIPGGFEKPGLCITFGGFPPAQPARVTVGQQVTQTRVDLDGCLAINVGQSCDVDISIG